MKNTIKAAAGLSMLAVSNAALAVSFGQEKADGLKTTDTPLDQLVVKWINYITTFLALIATAYGIYGGFKILTAGGNEDNVKQGKDIIIRAVLGLVVIFAINVIIRFVVKALFENS